MHMQLSPQKYSRCARGNIIRSVKTIQGLLHISSATVCNHLVAVLIWLVQSPLRNNIVLTQQSAIQGGDEVPVQNSISTAMPSGAVGQEPTAKAVNVGDLIQRGITVRPSAPPPPRADVLSVLPLDVSYHTRIVRRMFSLYWVAKRYCKCLSST